MMHVRPLTADEVERFAHVGTPPEHAVDVQRYLERLLSRGATRLDWCLLAEDHGRAVGRVALWALPGAARPSDLVLMEAPWDEADLTSARHLLTNTLARMRALGASTVGYVLDDPPQPPQWQFSRSRRIALLDHLGFALARETRRFRWTAEQAATGRPPAASARLNFRTLEEVSDDAFIAAIVRVTAGTLDRRLQRDRELLGPDEAARSLLELVREIGYEPGWWQLAYTPTGDLAGLVMPAGGEGTAVIGYIGVVPEQRGHGYSDDLLAQATSRLAASDVTTIVADTDTGNAPMANAFLRVGYAEFATRREYVLDLSALPMEYPRDAELIRP